MRDSRLTRNRTLAGRLAVLLLSPAAGRGQPNAEPLSACRAGMRPYAAADGLQLLGELVRADEILRQMGFDESPLTVYGVDLVPTFLFSHDGEELGRIVETPATTLEQDAAAIVATGPGLPPQPEWQ